MTTITSAVNAKKIRRDLIKWGIVLGVGVVLFLFQIGDVFVLLKTNQNIIGHKQGHEQALRNNEELTSDLATIREELLEKGKEAIDRDESLLPPQVELSRIAQALELYSLLLDQTDSNQNYSFVLQGVSFGRPKEKEGVNVFATPLEIRFEADEESFRDFMAFLEYEGDINAVLPDRIKNEVNRKGTPEDSAKPLKFDYISFAAIRTHTLPLINVVGMSINVTAKAQGQRVFEVELSAEVFSQAN